MNKPVASMFWILSPLSPEAMSWHTWLSPVHDIRSTSSSCVLTCYQVSAVLTELAAVYKALLPQAVVTELGSVCSAEITQGASAFTQTLVKHKDVSDFCLMLHLLKDLESVHTRICPAWGQRRDKDTQNKSRRTKMTTDSWQEGDETQND